MEDVHARVREIRHNKLIARPAAQKRARKAQKKKEDVAKTKLDKILAGMSEAEREAFIKMLEEQADD